LIVITSCNCSRNVLGGHTTEEPLLKFQCNVGRIKINGIESHKLGSNASSPRQLAVRLLLLAEPAVVTITAFADILGEGVDIAGPVRRVETDHLDDIVYRTPSCCYRGCG
jgi:hypothetical protein